MCKISVIVPIYNSEKLLVKCIQSLISQSFEDIEIILVDDGSTDSSPQICDEYANHDSRIRVIHKTNSGLGATYNMGMDSSNGEYIGFLESDDFAQENMFEDLYNLANKHGKPDIIKSGWFRYFSKTNRAEKDLQMTEFNSWQKFNIKEYPWLLNKQCSIWSAIYRTEFLRNKNVRFLETPGASYQDVSFTYKAFCNSESMVVTPDAYIHYRQDNEYSSVNSKEKSEVIFWEYEEVDRFFDENPQIKEWANTEKLAKQYYDYNWNFNRIADHLKPNFLIRFSNDFKKYRDNGELTPQVCSRIDMNNLNKIMVL